jgi:cytochrome c-type biogenesis protein CcmE
MTTTSQAPVRSRMTRKQRRAAFIAAGIGILCIAVFLVMFALRDTIVFFHTPAEIEAKQIPAGKRIRLGGLVAEGSLQRGGGATITFAITDTIKTVPVSYHGVLPDLFREGQGVVAEGKLDTSGRFLADTVLAKHDENYMPPEVAKALKEQGVWQHMSKDAKGSAPK